MSHESPKIEKIFTEEEIQNYIEQNSFNLPEDFKPHGENIGCIDDRADEIGSIEKIGIPGAGLGVLFTAFKAISVLEKKHEVQIVTNIEKIVSDVENITGKSFHTDEKNVNEHNPMSCAGCGHCAGILNSENDLDPMFTSFVKNNYLPKLKEEGYQPVVYKGEHNANAVIVIDDLKTGIRSKGDDGQVYVYNKAWHMEILKDVAKVLFEDLQILVPNITIEEVYKTLEEVSQEQLGKTVAHLAAGLPQKVISENVLA
ncbi:MAG: hypothetical protein NTW62_00035 [Candidatus Nomurabacteria bacterium]|nr:hypothetical protein [Candidatus Nomurabacteria bacterium]